MTFIELLLWHLSSFLLLVLFGCFFSVYLLNVDTDTNKRIKKQIKNIKKSHLLFIPVKATITTPPALNVFWHVSRYWKYNKNEHIYVLVFVGLFLFWNKYKFSQTFRIVISKFKTWLMEVKRTLFFFLGPLRKTPHIKVKLDNNSFFHRINFYDAKFW